MAFPFGRERVALDYGRAVAVATPVRRGGYRAAPCTCESCGRCACA
jgi:hypothetical protein